MTEITVGELLDFLTEQVRQRGPDFRKSHVFGQIGDGEQIVYLASNPSVESSAVWLDVTTIN